MSESDEVLNIGERLTDAAYNRFTQGEITAKDLELAYENIRALEKVLLPKGWHDNAPAGTSAN